MNDNRRYQAELFGKAFELLVKRGILFYLLENKLVSIERLTHIHPEYKRLLDINANEYRLESVFLNIRMALKVTSKLQAKQIRSHIEHLAYIGFLNGYIAIRDYITEIGKANFDRGRISVNQFRVIGIWCPMTMPTDEEDEEQRYEQIKRFSKEFGVPVNRQSKIYHQGRMMRSDFLLLLSDGNNEYLLVHEYSFDYASYFDFNNQSSHLEESLRRRFIIDSRGVFSNINTEISDKEYFSLSKNMSRHLTALTSKNKPFFKLCQAASYVDDFSDFYTTISERPLNTRALAITLNGFDSVGATYRKNKPIDTKIALVKELASAYLNYQRIADNDEEAFDNKIIELLQDLVNNLPNSLRNSVDGLIQSLPINQPYAFNLKESMQSAESSGEISNDSPLFYKPNSMFTEQAALDLVCNHNELLNDFFGCNAQDAILPYIQSRLDSQQKISLRNIHASSVIVTLKHGKKGIINLIGLEGNAGIGKTTAVKNFLLEDDEGFFLLYVSPRKLINGDVSRDLSRSEDNAKTGILTITSNSLIKTNAINDYEAKIKKGEIKAKLGSKRGAVVFDGIDDIKLVDEDIIMLTPEQEAELIETSSFSKYAKRRRSDTEDAIIETIDYGVLNSIGRAGKQLLNANEDITKFAITASIQSYRRKKNKNNAINGSTIDNLSSLFQYQVKDGKKALQEREKWFKKFPKIIVMVDEITGDGAGVTFIKDMISWLEKEFISPFAYRKMQSPFLITLIAADASLSSDIVLKTFVESVASDDDIENPEKIIVSKSSNLTPFAMSKLPIKPWLNKQYDMVHIMTNSFPADKLDVIYQVRVNEIEKLKTNDSKAARKKMSEDRFENSLQIAVHTIIAALDKSERKQVIYFAQHKDFLGSIREALVSRTLKEEDIEILDSNVRRQKSQEIIKDVNRDKTKVFLMTSTSARGISFPKCDYIIVDMPRFDIESNLMEIAQLIYRGRGRYLEGNKRVDGDNGQKTLHFIIQDYIVRTGEMDEDGLNRSNKRQWLKQLIDILTLIIILRSTIYTRIYGDSGLNEHMSLVPVGKIAVSESSSTVSEVITNFITQCQTAMREKSELSKEVYGALNNASENVFKLFKDMRLRLKQRQKDTYGDIPSFSNIDYVKYINHRISSQLLLMPEKLDEDKGYKPFIPNYTYINGTTVIEDYSQFTANEKFEFSKIAIGDEKQTVQHLINQVYMISENLNFNEELRSNAKTIVEILERRNSFATDGSDTEEQDTNFSITKLLSSKNLWVAMPADYQRFLHADNQLFGERFVLDEAEVWQSVLAGDLGARNGVIPPIPVYDAQPFVAIVSQNNPLKPWLLYDDRYFTASKTLNLLNTILINKNS